MWGITKIFGFGWPYPLKPTKTEPSTPLLSGLKMLASGPQISGSRCKATIKVHTITPLGTFMSPNFMS